MELVPHERYRYKPYLGSSHLWALEQCERMPTNSRVLDIGAGSGAIGEELKKRGFEHLKAVEIDPNTRSHLAGIYGSVESEVEAYTGEQFDLVLLLDVLEHMTDPEGFLQKLRSFLAPGARLLISVPNIAHWSVRIPMLFGFFEYTSRGILDRTHYQFFTRNRFTRLVTTPAGARIEKVAASIEPAEFVLPQGMWDNEIFRTISRFRIALAQIFPGLFAYQHLALIRI